MVTAMLSQDEAIKTLRDLAEGVARLEQFFGDGKAEPQATPAETTPTIAATPSPAKEVSAFETAPSALLEADVATRKEQLRELEERAAQAESRLAEADRTVAELEANRKAISDLTEREKTELARLKDARAKAEQMIQAASQHEEKAAQIDHREKELDAEATRLNQLRQELEAKAADVARWRAEADEAAHLKEKLWPDWLRAGSLAVWKEKLEDAISSGSATPVAALLFSALHGYTAATKDSDLKLLHDSLREVSRRLFPWLKENGLDEHGAVETGGQFADEINRECQSRAEVEIPALGAPATNQWMIFRPKPGVNSPDVAGVQTWCVRNAQKQPIHRAEITV